MARPRKSINEKELLKLYIVEGLTTREVAKKMGISKATVSRRLKELGVKVKRKIVVEKTIS